MNVVHPKRKPTCSWPHRMFVHNVRTLRSLQSKIWDMLGKEQYSCLSKEYYAPAMLETPHKWARWQQNPCQMGSPALQSRGQH